MPELAEVSRIVHYLKKHAVGRTIEAVKAQEDDIIFGKVGTSASAIKNSLTGKKILDARQQGKYFWLVMESAPHPLMHFGMAGWMKFSNDDNAHYRPPKPEQAEWPPRFWKFVLQLKGEPKCEVAFVDARRLARVRLVDAEADQMRKTSPLKENGPDPVLDKDILTAEWLGKKMRGKKVPVKAFLLNQASVAGLGNWLVDEIMYQARLHPEQYSNTFSDEQIERLHKTIMYVCDTAVEVLADSDRFPEDWLMKHRWGKGKKEAQKLPNGEKITFLKVGGRTSAIVPSVQKKTAAVAGDVSEGAEDDEEAKPKRGGKRKTKTAKEEEDEDDEVEVKTSAKPKRGKKKADEEVKKEAEDVDEGESLPATKKQKTATNGAVKKSKKTKTEAVQVKSEDTTVRRRSGRLTK